MLLMRPEDARFRAVRMETDVESVGFVIRAFFIVCSFVLRMMTEYVLTVRAKRQTHTGFRSPRYYAIYFSSCSVDLALWFGRRFPQQPPNSAAVCSLCANWETFEGDGWSYYDAISDRGNRYWIGFVCKRCRDVAGRSLPPGWIAETI